MRFYAQILKRAAGVLPCGWCEYRNKEGNCTFYSGNEKWKDEWEYCSNGKPKK